MVGVVQMVIWKRDAKSGDLATTCSNSVKARFPSLMTSHSVMTFLAIASSLSSGILSPIHRENKIQFYTKPIHSVHFVLYWNLNIICVPQ